MSPFLEVGIDLPFHKDILQHPGRNPAPQTGHNEVFNSAFLCVIDAGDALSSGMHGGLDIPFCGLQGIQRKWATIGDDDFLL